VAHPPFFLSAGKRIVAVSVRELVEFVLRTGGLGGSGRFSGPKRALEGTRAHIKHQKSKPAGYESEVSVARDIETPTFTLQLKGRIDGLLAAGSELLIEEIKTVAHLAQLKDGTADPLHWAQAKIYACLYAEDHGFLHADIQVTYLELETLRTREHREPQSLDELRAFFDSVTNEYLNWLHAHDEWLQRRDASIVATTFPFNAYRPGQRSLAVAAFRAIKSRDKLFAEAPTGIGKTISVLFPAIKALGERHVEKIFYATAKTVGRTVAEKALTDLRDRGLRLRSVTLTAKDKVCFNDGKSCDLLTCPFAVGYYDRIKAALKDGLDSDVFTRVEIEALARKHQVCPFELSLDLSVWADAVICDYNYVFDPSVSLKRYFSEDRQEFAILVDEAHNLVDRAREMFSAELLRDEVTQVKEHIEAELPGCARILKKVYAQFAAFTKADGATERGGAFVTATVPAKLTKLLKEFAEQAESWLAQNETSGFKEVLLDFYFKALTFARTAELYDERYVTCYDPEARRIKLFCMDPSALIRESLERVGSAVFFSATLNPIEYFRESLGGRLTDAGVKLTSPFARENLLVMAQDRIPTTLRARHDSIEAVADSIGALVGSKRGNYLVYFPSYDYMARVLESFRARFPDIEAIAQKAGMTENEREEFLGKFAVDSERTFVAFAVLGGIFGEGIDLVGERLIGVVVVGIGLPQISLERDLIREYWQNAGRSGFDYAYTFPGMNRVLQAVGRLIRSETDRGVVLLIDERFGRRLQRELFPDWWEVRITRDAAEIGAACEQFWSVEQRATLLQDVAVGI
jgi:DNA excision repair protein ERCC-2